MIGFFALYIGTFFVCFLMLVLGSDGSEEELNRAIFVTIGTAIFIPVVTIGCFMISERNK